MKSVQYMTGNTSHSVFHDLVDVHGANANVIKLILVSLMVSKVHVSAVGLEIWRCLTSKSLVFDGNKEWYSFIRTIWCMCWISGVVDALYALPCVKFHKNLRWEVDNARQNNFLTKCKWRRVYTLPALELQAISLVEKKYRSWCYYENYMKKCIEIKPRTWFLPKFWWFD